MCAMTFEVKQRVTLFGSRIVQEDYIESSLLMLQTHQHVLTSEHRHVDKLLPSTSTDSEDLSVTHERSRRSDVSIINRDLYIDS